MRSRLRDGCMSESENKLLIRRFIEEVINTGNVSRLSEFVALDFREQDDPSGRIAGIEGCRQHIVAVRTTYPDLNLAIEDQIAEGDLVATRVVMTGTRGSRQYCNGCRKAKLPQRDAARDWRRRVREKAGNGDDH